MGYPADKSERMSPYKFGMTMTRSLYGVGSVTICLVEYRREIRIGGAGKDS